MSNKAQTLKAAPLVPSLDTTRRLTASGGSQTAAPHPGIEATAIVPAPAKDVFAFLADLENHWLVADRFVGVITLEGPRGARSGGVVALRGPLGLRRTEDPHPGRRRAAPHGRHGGDRLSNIRHRQMVARRPRSGHQSGARGNRRGSGAARTLVARSRRAPVASPPLRAHLEAPVRTPQRTPGAATSQGRLKTEET
jgi:hypothetical protein